jgi:hypothetical protein
MVPDINCTIPACDDEATAVRGNGDATPMAGGMALRELTARREELLDRLGRPADHSSIRVHRDASIGIW